MDILEILPTGLHDRLPVFIGSKEDVSELVSYGDVQQGVTSYSSDDTPVGLASLQRMLGLTDKFWQKMRRNVPEVDEYVRGGPGAASGWANLRELQARVGLSDKELKAVVQRLPQLLWARLRDGGRAAARASAGDVGPRPSAAQDDRDQAAADARARLRRGD